MEEFNKFNSSLENLWLAARVRSYACMKLNDFIIIKVNPSQKVSKAVLKDKQNKKDIISTLPPEVQGELKKINEKLRLNQKELQKIKKQLKTIDSSNQDFQDLIKEVNGIVSQVRAESNKEKLINEFRKSSSKFNDNISDELLELDNNSKDVVKETFTQLTDLMNDYQEKLTNS